MKTLLNHSKLLLLTTVFLFTSAKQLFPRTAETDSLLVCAQQEQNLINKIPLYFQIGSGFMTEHHDSAFIFYRAGLLLARTLRQDSLTGIGYYYLASLEAKRNNYRSALTYSDSAINYLKHTKSYLQLSEIKNIKGTIYLKHLNAETKQNRSAIRNQQQTKNILLIIVAVLIFFSVLMFNRYQLKKKIESQQLLLNERKRISHELHDDLGSQLCAARLFLSNFKNSNDHNTNRVLIDNSIDLVDTCIKDLRCIMNDLQTPALLQNGYIAATTELVNKVNQLKQIHFSLSHNGIQKRLEPKKESSLYRITQELINNTLKYAQARNVTIDVLNRDNNIVLMYEDDGNGCNLQSARKGYGLNNILSRSKSVGGTVAFDSFPGAGFRAVVEIPLLYA